MKRFILIFLLAGTCHAQCQPGLKCTDLPDKPTPTVRVKLIDESINRPVWLTLPVPHRTADKSFWIAQALVQASTIVDVEVSVNSLKKSGVVELNPLLGKHPSRLRYYGTNEALNFTIGYLSWRAKRSQDAAHEFGAKQSWDRWWVASAATVAVHMFGVGFTLAETRR